VSPATARAEEQRGHDEKSGHVERGEKLGYIYIIRWFFIYILILVNAL